MEVVRRPATAQPLRATTGAAAIGCRPVEHGALTPSAWVL